MVSQNVSRILQQVQALSEEERQQLRRLLDEPGARQTELSQQEKVRQRLVERGLLEADPPRGKDPERYRRWRPIPIQGQPLSATIIEERR